MIYNGSCHCGSIAFQFESVKILEGLRCNCSLCRRKGAIMTNFTVSPKEIEIQVEDGALSTYEFRSAVAKHHFCNKCGVYTFHQTMSKPGHYRINIGCIDGIESTEIPFEIFDGAAF